MTAATRHRAGTVTTEQADELVRLLDAAIARQSATLAGIARALMEVGAPRLMPAVTTAVEAAVEAAADAAVAEVMGSSGPDRTALARVAADARDHAETRIRALVAGGAR